MSKDINQLILVGRLTIEPELKYTKTGTPYCMFIIANNQQFGIGNEKSEYVNYFTINCWGSVADNCSKYLKKGKQVAIIGEIKQNRWKDQAGYNKSRLEINAKLVQFLFNLNENNNQNFNQNGTSKDPFHR